VAFLTSATLSANVCSSVSHNVFIKTFLLSFNAAKPEIWALPLPLIPIIATFTRSLAPTIEAYDLALNPLPARANPAEATMLFFIKSLLPVIQINFYVVFLIYL
jgi:hypothetical protein